MRRAQEALPRDGGLSHTLRPQEVEVAPLVRTQNVLGEQPSVAPGIVRLRRGPLRKAPLDLPLVDEQVQASVRHVELDQIAVSNRRQRAALHNGDSNQRIRSYLLT